MFPNICFFYRINKVIFIIIKYDRVLNTALRRTRGVFRTQRNIYDAAYLRK